MNALKIYVFNRVLYDGIKSGVINGLQLNTQDVYSSEDSNYSTQLLRVSNWEELSRFDVVIWGEEEFKLVNQLGGQPRLGQVLVYVDGGDYIKLKKNPVVRPHLIFKRELLTKVHQRSIGQLQPFSFSLEDRFLQPFRPFQDRQFDISCMLRLQTNEFRIEIDKALKKYINTNPNLNSFIGLTQEVSYGLGMGMPQPTPKYHSILSQSKISINCYGAGQDCYRFWEILGAGAMLFSQRLTIAQNNPLQDGLHAVFFSDIQEFNEKLDFYLHQPKLVEEIAWNGRQFALEHHTTTARGKTLLTKIIKLKEDLDAGKSVDPEQNLDLVYLMNNLIYYKNKHSFRVVNTIKSLKFIQ